MERFMQKVYEIKKQIEKTLDSKINGEVAILKKDIFECPTIENLPMQLLNYAGKDELASLNTAIVEVELKYYNTLEKLNVDTVQYMKPQVESDNESDFVIEIENLEDTNQYEDKKTFSKINTNNEDAPESNKQNISVNQSFETKRKFTRNTSKLSNHAPDILLGKKKMGTEAYQKLFNRVEWVYTKLNELEDKTVKNNEKIDDLIPEFQTLRSKQEHDMIRRNEIECKMRQVDKITSHLHVDTENSRNQSE